MTTTNTIGATKTDENTHPFAGPEFVVFPHAKREKIRQALLDAHQVYHLQQMLAADVRGLTFSHEMRGRVYTIEMYLGQDDVWQMRVPRPRNDYRHSFVVLNEHLYKIYLREPDHALGAVTTKRTLCLCDSARRVASNALIS